MSGATVDAAVVIFADELSVFIYQIAARVAQRVGLDWLAHIVRVHVHLVVESVQTEQTQLLICVNRQI